jgi:PKD repeat protein
VATGGYSQFNVSDNEVYVGEEVTFINNSTGATNYEWQLGDGTYSHNSTMVSHEYDEPDEYVVQ